MISTSNVTLRVGKKALFEDVNIKFTEGNCYGLIGANGAGKSTFLKILSGQLEPTSGEVIISPGDRLSFLQQDHFKYDQYPVLDTVIMGNVRLYEIMKEKEVIYAKEDFTDEDGKAYRGRKVAVLNFANNHSIGGAPFSAGAQEESLCRQLCSVNCRSWFFVA